MVQQFKPVTHIIFDMDGLLLNTEPRYDVAINKMCNKFGVEYSDEAKRAAKGRTAQGAAEAVITTMKLPITIDEFLVQIEEYYKDVFADYVEFMPGADRLVDHLKSHNIPICVATSSKDSTFKLKEKHHPTFFPKFSHIVKGSDDPEVKNGKPAPDIFLIAANRFDKPPSPDKCLVFEDSANGVKAAVAAGMQVVWVPPPIADTNSAQATLVIDSLENFKPELFGLPPFKN